MFFKVAFLLFLVFITPLNALYHIGDTVMINNGPFYGERVMIVGIPTMAKGSKKGFDDQRFMYLRTKNKETNKILNSIKSLTKITRYYKAKFEDDSISSMVHIIHSANLSRIPELKDSPLKVWDFCNAKNKGKARILGKLSDNELLAYCTNHPKQIEVEEFLDNVTMEVYGQPVMVDPEEVIKNISPDHKPIHLVRFSDSQEYELCLSTDLAPLQP